MKHVLTASRDMSVQLVVHRKKCQSVRSVEQIKKRTYRERMGQLFPHTTRTMVDDREAFSTTTISAMENGLHRTMRRMKAIAGDIEDSVTVAETKVQKKEKK